MICYVFIVELLNLLPDSQDIFLTTLWSFFHIIFFVVFVLALLVVGPHKIVYHSFSFGDVIIDATNKSEF